MTTATNGKIGFILSMLELFAVFFDREEEEKREIANLQR